MDYEWKYFLKMFLEIYFREIPGNTKRLVIQNCILVLTVKIILINWSTPSKLTIGTDRFKITSLYLIIFRILTFHFEQKAQNLD